MAIAAASRSLFDLPNTRNQSGWQWHYDLANTYRYYTLYQLLGQRWDVILPPFSKLFTLRPYSSDHPWSQAEMGPLFQLLLCLCHAFATRGHWINMRPCWRVGAEGLLRGVCPLPLMNTLGRLETRCGVLSYTSSGLPLESMTLRCFPNPLGFYLGCVFHAMEKKNGKSMLFCIVQSSVCLFMMGSLLGSPLKRNCERNQTGKGGTMLSIRSITGSAQAQ